MLKEFKVNEYITLKLENGRTNIYVKGKWFSSCTFLLLNIPIEKISTFDEIESTDDAVEKLYQSLEGWRPGMFEISPEIEFWGHCSNLQVWAEMDYNTRLLPRNIAFPLLKRLSVVGDPTALKAFKREILSRLSDGNKSVITYLTLENYLEFLTTEDKRQLHLSVIEEIEKIQISINNIEKLMMYPKYVKNIDTKIDNSQITKTLVKPLTYYKNHYINSAFGDHILEYGISLLENGYIINAGEILTYVWAAESEDTSWPQALFHKARIAAILKNADYVIEFLRMAFRAAAYFDNPPGTENRLKEMIEKLPEFNDYKDNLSFRRIITHNYNNVVDIDEFNNELIYTIQVLERKNVSSFFPLFNPEEKYFEYIQRLNTEDD